MTGRETSGSIPMRRTEDAKALGGRLCWSTPREEGGSWGAEGLVRDETRKGTGAKSYLGSRVRISVSFLRAVGGL